VGSPADCTGDRVVDRVVIGEERHANDVHGEVCWEDEEDALTSFDLEEVVFGLNFEPFLVEHKPDSGVFFIAVRHYNAALERPFRVGHLRHNLSDKRLEVER